MQETIQEVSLEIDVNLSHQYGIHIQFWKRIQFNVSQSYAWHEQNPSYDYKVTS